MSVLLYGHRSVRVHRKAPALWVHTGELVPRSATFASGGPGSRGRYAVLARAGSAPDVVRYRGWGHVTDATAEARLHARLDRAADKLEQAGDGALAEVVRELAIQWHSFGLARHCGMNHCGKVAEWYDEAGVGWCFRHVGYGLPLPSSSNGGSPP
jgi:hypothetical protein